LGRIEGQIASFYPPVKEIQCFKATRNHTQIREIPDQIRAQIRVIRDTLLTLSQTVSLLIAPHIQ
jgi:hypothetical protein